MDLLRSVFGGNGAAEGEEGEPDAKKPKKEETLPTAAPAVAEA